ncbi:sensor histidine kinase [Microbacterium sp. SORGH_AS_0888]|uniref:sensor histidine kinase n=1 Tax=Microbacterium sp. SORGH_AS_0888 TaxID=3041791 RepID=UPI002784CA3D|nr:ATP-binding protein [Microbacterium sp. SORGH_AS_0888]MDQ1131394.1 signal transduction histidine kinase [Microbacterium sp. SORGH_AS_0888]
MPAKAREAMAAADASGLMPAVEVASFTRARVERVMTVSVALGCAVLGGQALVGAIGDTAVSGPANLALMILSFAPLAVMLVAFFAGRFERSAASLFIGAYVLVLLLWPFAPSAASTDVNAQPWVYFLINVATVPAVLVMPMALQIAVTVGLPLLYGIVRLVELCFAATAWWPVLLDVSFSLIFGSVLLTLGWTFRAAASDVDERRLHAVSSYARAAAVSASERERVAVAALMHDSVLAALIAAERADSPRERDLAVSMAREALTRLANTDRDVGEGSDAPVPPTAVVDGLVDALTGTDADVSVDLAPGTPEVPGRVARALVLAATQAISNAVQHADGRDLAVSVIGTVDPAGLIVRVSDGGPGFDVDAVPADRLGIRASILARVTAFGGRAHVDSGDQGTVVTLVWRRAEQ